MNENMKQARIEKNLSQKQLVKITYFVHDKLKSGGEYQMITQTIKQIDAPNQLLITEDKQKINIADIIDLEFV